jgi:hypothetical protein
LKIVLLLIIFSIACTKKEDYWDKLTPAEQAQVRSIAQSKCTNDNNQAKIDYKAESNAFSANYARGDGYEFKFFEGSNTSPIITKKIIFLRVEATQFYAWLVTTLAGTTTNQLIRYQTSENEANIDQLITDYCINKTIKLSETSTNVWSAYEEDISSEDTATDDVTIKETRKYKFYEPVFFADFNLSKDRVVKVISTAATTTTSYTSTFTAFTPVMPTLEQLNAALHCTMTDTSSPYEPTACANNAFTTTNLCDVCPQ